MNELTDLYEETTGASQFSTPGPTFFLPTYPEIKREP